MICDLQSPTRHTPFRSSTSISTCPISMLLIRRQSPPRRFSTRFSFPMYTIHPTSRHSNARLLFKRKKAHSRASRHQECASHFTLRIAMRQPVHMLLSFLHPLRLLIGSGNHSGMGLTHGHMGFCPPPAVREGRCRPARRWPARSHALPHPLAEPPPSR